MNLKRSPEVALALGHWVAILRPVTMVWSHQYKWWEVSHELCHKTTTLHINQANKLSTLSSSTPRMSKIEITKKSAVFYLCKTFTLTPIVTQIHCQKFFSLFNKLSWRWLSALELIPLCHKLLLEIHNLYFSIYEYQMHLFSNCSICQELNNKRLIGFLRMEHSLLLSRS